jgi:hypothetical protein
MTKLLEQALGEVQKLPDVAQDAIAAIILEEIADERRWDEAFARSQAQLGRLASRVREDIFGISGRRHDLLVLDRLARGIRSAPETSVIPEPTPMQKATEAFMQDGENLCATLLPRNQLSYPTAQDFAK